MASAEVLGQVPLFADLAPGELAALATVLQRRRYRKGETIFHQGDPGTSLFIIELGEVKIALPSPDGREMILALLGPGDFFGELALLDEEPRSATAVAQEASQLLLLQRAQFIRFLRERPQAALPMMASLARRLRRTDTLVHEVVFLDVPTRLVRTLLRLAETQGRQTDDGVVIASRLTQGDLADMIGATRESTNKWLRFYERQGLVRHRQGRLTLLRPQELCRRYA